ncbi:MAG: hypothetical protein HYV26_22865 [Candidatus Hydrogenedentes bacterium]|nr:hypothetical protein [Candidatus Hydrogenedentota bacterium]
MARNSLQFIVVLTLLLGLPQAAAQEFPTALERERAQAEILVERLPVAELLGPLAPVALSPFMGLTCLSGITLLQQQGVLGGNLLLEQHPLLGDLRFFLVLLFLTLLTSVPKLFTVSKFFAQAVDWVEAYTGLILFLLVMVLGSSVPPPHPEFTVVQAGVFSAGQNLLLMAAVAVNFIVVNTVKYFFEVLVLLTPIPLLDATFEIANKSLCFALAAAYAINPYLALVPGALLFLACLPLFYWAHRGMVYYKTLLLDPVLKSLWLRLRGHAVSDVSPRLIWFLEKVVGRPVSLAVKVFPQQPFAGLRRKRLLLLAIGEHSAHLVALRWWRAPVIVPLAGLGIALERGILVDSFHLRAPGGSEVRFVFSRYYRPHLPLIASGLGLRLSNDAETPEGAQPVWRLSKRLWRGNLG